MISNLRYGADASLRLELAGDTPVTVCDAPHGEPLAHVADAVDRALAEPLAFPSLAQAVVPGDKVVLALAEAVPQAATIVARTVDRLLGAGVAAGDITLLSTLVDVAGRPDPLAELPNEVRAAIECQTHDPSSRGSLAYLGASAGGDPIYINRAIHDADLVVTIGCLRVGDSLGYHGVQAGVFPTFADADTIKRYRSPRSDEPRKRERLRQAANEAVWLLGVHFTVQVVPGAAAEILHVLAGEADAVVREGHRRFAEAWHCAVPERAALVVATIEGDATQQTWDNVARALACASHAVREDGAVAVCSELVERLGPALECLAGVDDLDAAPARNRPAQSR